MARAFTPGLARFACLVALAASAGGCARTGDFGRPEPNVFSDTILPAIGYASGTARGDQPSLAGLTDDEQEMRNRAWRFLMPAHERSVFERHLSEFALTHVIPKESAESRPDIYQLAIAGPTPSPLSRYRRLTADIDADRALIPPFSSVTARVSVADGIRRGALAKLTLTEQEQINAELRLDENEALVVWVCEKLTERAAAYQVALNGLIVEVPDKIAVESERALIALKADIRILCGNLGTGHRGKKNIPRGAPPLVVKG